MLQNQNEDWNNSREEEDKEEGGITIRVGLFFEQRQLTEEIWYTFFSEVFLAVVQSSFCKMPPKTGHILTTQKEFRFQLTVHLSHLNMAIGIYFSNTKIPLHFFSSQVLNSNKYL